MIADKIYCAALTYDDLIKSFYPDYRSRSGIFFVIWDSYENYRKEGTDSMEIWDAYDKNGIKAGFDLVRDEAIPDRYYHLVCDVIVKHADGTFLLMQRDFQKKGWPGKYKASAGGSVLKGETPLQGAIRELREETGIIAKDLMQTYHVVSEHYHSIFDGYLCSTDCAKDSVTLQEGETIAYKWVNAKELREIVRSEDYVDTLRIRQEEFLKMIE